MLQALAPQLQIQLSMSIGHSFARGGNGYAVSGVEKDGEGLRGRKLPRKCRSVRPAVEREIHAHAFVAVFAGKQALTEPQIARCLMFTAEVVLPLKARGP